MFDLKGKVAVVTGGNGGIGLGMAQGLAAAGARVVVAARNQTKSAAAVRQLGGQALAIAVDVADEPSVNALLPGWIDTDLTRGARRQVEGLHENVLRRTPAGRWGTIEDMAGVAVFLASPASDFVTGTAIPVDGGYSVLG